MRGSDFNREIASSVDSDELVEDVAVMIDIVASRRAEGRMLEEGDYFFAASVICILLEPIKPDEYKKEISKMRHAFKDIANDKEKQDWFRYSLTNRLLQLDRIEEAVQQPVAELFAYVYVAAGA